jgi:hypothetical protein
MARKARAPWKRSNPRKRAGKQSRHLTSAQKATAKTRARRAGRSYPNLVDNMRMASKAKKKKTAKKSPAKKAARKRSAKKTAKKSLKKKAAKKSPGAAREKDPKGGLTAAGRAAFARKDGSHLKPGVTKSSSEMTRQDMRRKGSWAVRFYGRKKLPPLVDARGKPTRHALSAPRVGRARSENRRRCATHCRQGRTAAARYHRIKKA